MYSPCLVVNTVKLYLLNQVEISLLSSTPSLPLDPTHPLTPPTPWLHPPPYPLHQFNFSTARQWSLTGRFQLPDNSTEHLPGDPGATEWHRLCGSLGQFTKLCNKNTELCNKNTELCNKNTELCDKNTELCNKNTELCIKYVAMFINFTTFTCTTSDKSWVFMVDCLRHTVRW